MLRGSPRLKFLILVGAGSHRPSYATSDPTTIHPPGPPPPTSSVHCHFGSVGDVHVAEGAGARETDPIPSACATKPPPDSDHSTAHEVDGSTAPPDCLRQPRALRRLELPASVQATTGRAEFRRALVVVVLGWRRRDGAPVDEIVGSILDTLARRPHVYVVPAAAVAARRHAACIGERSA